MADFTITFKNNNQFTFNDLTDYSGIVGEDDSVLKVTYPPDLVTGTEITLNLYNENIVAFGDSFTFVIADEPSLSQLTTGVYKFTLEILQGATVLETVTKYYINPYDIQSCLRRNSDIIMDEQCSEDWCKFGLIGALLDVAIREAGEDRFDAAQEIMDYLTTKCNEC